MASTAFYHKNIRKITAAFASLFNNILLIRYDQDGTEEQRLIVPIEYADKEKYIKRLQGDPDLDKKIQTVLPRMSYQMTSFEYDSARKLNTNNQNFSNVNGNFLAAYNPVPYDFGFALTIYTRNVEDGNQILEQILPYFTPDYTLKVNMVPEMNIIRNIPIKLNQVTSTIDSDGLFNSEVRTIFWTLNFTVKGFIFGPSKDVPLIKTVQIDYIDYSTMYEFSANDIPLSDYINGEAVYQGLNLTYATAKGIVNSWNPESQILNIKEIVGDFDVNQPITGFDSLTVRVPLGTYGNSNVAVEQTITTLVPYTANITDSWTSNTVIYNDITISL